MNDFDFYSVEAHSTSIRALTKVGCFHRESIKTQIDWSTRFPTHNHHAIIGFVDVNNIGHDEARKRADELVSMLPTIDGVKYYVRFYPSD
jgi:hypothetical protein